MSSTARAVNAVMEIEVRMMHARRVLELPCRKAAEPKLLDSHPIAFCIAAPARRFIGLEREDMYCLLFYDYVENIVERRAPYRDAHLAMVREYVDRGELILGGAFAEPADGAAIAFNVPDRARVEEFARNDPYVVNGLVTAWRVREWAVVVGTAL